MSRCIFLRRTFVCHVGTLDICPAQRQTIFN
jgi:hypothetical protein